MYGLPAGVDFNFFVRCILTQVCFGAHEVTLRFGDELAVTVEGKLGIQLSDAAERVYEDLRLVAAELVQLIEVPVVDAIPESGLLTLVLENGCHVRIYDSEVHYESFQIRYGDTLYVV